MKCRAYVRRYIGQLMGPASIPCSKNARPGCVTCAHHKGQETELRRLDKGHELSPPSPASPFRWRKAPRAP